MTLNVPRLVRRIALPVGVGAHRVVFALKDDPGLVVKIVHRFHTGASNRREYETYHAAPRELQRFLCPALAISSCGRYLLMARGYTFTGDTSQIEMPEVLKQGDWQKGKNWVTLGDERRPVRCDYTDLRL